MGSNWVSGAASPEAHGTWHCVKHPEALDAKPNSNTSLRADCKAICGLQMAAGPLLDCRRTGPGAVRLPAQISRPTAGVACSLVPRMACPVPRWTDPDLCFSSRPRKSPRTLRTSSVLKALSLSLTGLTGHSSGQKCARARPKPRAVCVMHGFWRATGRVCCGMRNSNAVVRKASQAFV